MTYSSSEGRYVTTQAVSLLRSYGKTLKACGQVVADLAKGNDCASLREFIRKRRYNIELLRMTSSEMLRFLTQKLKSQSINEVQPFPEQAVDENDDEDDDRDSGTESDDENAQFDDLDNDPDDVDRCHHETSSYGSASPVNHPPSPVDMEGMRTHELTVNSLDTISYTSDLDGHGWDYERHSSEEELVEINSRETVAEKRKWSQVNRGSVGDSAGSSDEEVRELLKPQPVVFSASPPCVQKLHSSPPAKFFLANMSPKATTVVAAISPRKRHRQLSTSECPTDWGDAETLIQRPCLDFEKMQKTSVKKPCVQSSGRPKLVKIRTINGSGRGGPKCLSDPAIFSFRSISIGFSPLTPVEEPSCAY